MRTGVRRRRSISRQQESAPSVGQGHELGQLFMTVRREQARHNLQLVTAVAKAQGDIVRASFEQLSRLNGRYREIFQGLTSSWRAPQA